MKNDNHSRDGSFVVIFSGKLKNWQEMEFLLGSNISDHLYELLGGGFDISDLTPDKAACREVYEETEGDIILSAGELTYFSHMVQKLPRLGENEKGHVFYFFKEFDNKKHVKKVSSEHSELAWHKLSDIFNRGESMYRTSTLRVIIIFLNYLSNMEFHFGILGDKVTFREYKF